MSRGYDEEDVGCLLEVILAISAGATLALLAWVVLNTAARMGAG